MMELLHQQNSDEDRINGDMRLKIKDQRLFEMSAPIELLPIYAIRELYSDSLEHVSPPLSKIEIEDIKLSQEEYLRGEAPIFDSVDEMLKYIYEEECESEDEEQ